MTSFSEARASVARGSEVRTTTRSFSEKVINDLRSKVNEDDKGKVLRSRLEASLTQASQIAAKGPGKGGLYKGLYGALKWPTKFESSGEYDYIDYLTDFARWIPKQASEPPWSEQGEKSREVLDRLCHFYWLIDQPLTKGKKVVEEDEWFREWLIDYADAWGSFLDTTESFNHDTLNSFIEHSKKYRVQDSMIGTEPHWRPNAPTGWLTFNQFFARRLNSGLRPIDNPNDNECVTAPADCTYKKHYSINGDSHIDNIQITIKGVTRVATVMDLLGDQYDKNFANGIFTHYFLSPYSYHHFHAPVAGQVVDCRSVRERVYLDVNITNDGEFDAPDTSETGYEFTQSRGILVIDTSVKNPNDTVDYGNIGLVAVVPVGMAQVSSVTMMATVGQYLRKGDEFGYFTFGGSNIIMLFDHAAEILTQPEKAPPPPFDRGYFLYGSHSVTCTKKPSD